MAFKLYFQEDALQQQVLDHHCGSKAKHVSSFFFFHTQQPWPASVSLSLGGGEGSLARNDVLIRRRELSSECSSSPPQRKESLRSWCSRKIVGNVALQRCGLVYSASAYLLYGHMAARDATKTVESRSSLRNDGGRRDLGRRPSRRPLALHALPMNRYISQLGLSSRRVDSMKFAPVIYEAF